MSSWALRLDVMQIRWNHTKCNNIQILLAATTIPACKDSCQLVPVNLFRQLSPPLYYCLYADWIDISCSSFSSPVSCCCCLSALSTCTSLAYYLSSSTSCLPSACQPEFVWSYQQFNCYFYLLTVCFLTSFIYIICPLNIFIFGFFHTRLIAHCYSFCLYYQLQISFPCPFHVTKSDIVGRRTAFVN